MLIKVCGMRDPDNIRAVEALGIDMMGFIFYPKSKRYVAETPAYLPTKCRRVGVFVNSGIDDIRNRAKDFRLDCIQLHGDEPISLCERLRSEGHYVIKALQISDKASIAAADEYAEVADMLLLDTATKGYGGSGETFDWGLIDSYRADTPFLLSGGINPAHAEALRAINHRRYAGIDVNSGFEQSPALKDIEKLETFIKEIRK